MRVVVGSKNPTKVEGTRQAFLQYFEDVEVTGVEVKTDIPSQPFDGETITGAIERAKKSYSSEYDFSVGIEAGLFRFDGTITGYIDFQVAAIYNGKVYTLGFGPGFEYPPMVIGEVLKGKEVGDVMSELSGIEDLGKKTGAVHYLSKGVISRTELARLSVTMALIPWINRELYL
ncbi:inosine/xanthosine triphosphatase [Archaeoglobus neptunius]|uniref:inosine/xanthosine triphosphatase n=1 Tax=Archaeoglobus neptunius TaxID=2798580 RepID=UPI001926AA78|nr:inosine/xanthosine triphosphatase [Archaeoglobus neptunius]